MIGKIISHYRILRELGRGGMGEIYLAEDMWLGRNVALKFLPLQYTHDPDLRARFAREARVVATLNYPNIITIYEFGEFEGKYYIVMEYVDGESLRDLISREELAIPLVIDIAAQICAGLGAAHRAGVVHRDVKAGNILITKAGNVKISDFGLAKLQNDTQITRTGAIMGTPHYMAPEQVKGEVIDHRADIFSFGIVLYEMLTRQLPFKGDGQLAVLYAILHEKPTSLSLYKPDIPKGLQKIIDKALEKNPNTRYQLIEDLMADLKRLDLRSKEKATAIIRKPRAIEKPRGFFSFKRLLNFFSNVFSFGNQKTKEKPIPGKSHEPISSKAEKASPPVPRVESEVLPSYTFAKTVELDSRVGSLPPGVEPEVLPSDTFAKTVNLDSRESFPSPVVEPEVLPSIDQPSLFLKREHSILTSYANKRVIEEIILYEDFERLKSFITDSEGGRFVLTGYGRFGGTSLVKGAMNRAKRELKKRGQSEGDLLTFNFNIEESSEKTGKFEIDAIEFSFGTLSTQDESIKKLNLDTPRGNSFFGKPAPKNKSSNFEYNELIEQLKNFSAQDSDKSRLHEIVFELIGNESLPARVIVILDRVCHLETLESLAQVELFKNKKITVIAVARKEDFDRWVKYEQRLNKIGFKKWYVPCISLKESDFIQKISQVLLEPHLIQNPEAKDTLVHLRKHLEFVGKGILGEVLEELKHPQYWSSNKAGGFYLRLDTLPHQRNIKHNAWMQDVLSENWNVISGKLFPKDEQEDRARISCYHLVDWIADHPIFTKEQLFETAHKVPITVSDNQEVLTEVVENLLQVLKTNHYLILKGKDQYRVMWDNSSPPQPRKVRIKSPTILAKAQRLTNSSMDENVSVKMAEKQPISDEIAKDIVEVSEFEKIKAVGADKTEGSIILEKRKIEIEEEEFTIPKNIFISYSHKDREWLDKIRIMLKPLERKLQVTIWDDTKIKPGYRWREEIKQALESAKVAVLLVSPDFLNSDFIAEHELPPLLNAAEKNGLIILWILISHCMYQETEVNSYQAAHDISKPLDGLQVSEQNRILAQIGERIKQVINSP